MRIIFVGPPGVGKGTQSQRLVKHLGIPQVSTGEMLRKAISENTEIGKLSEKYLTIGRLVPDEIILKVVGDRLEEPDCRRGYLLDGFPRTLGQAQALDRYLTDRGTQLDGVLELKVDDDEIVRRLAGRARDDDRPEIILERLKQYISETAPLVEYYEKRGLLYKILGTGTPDQVFERIRGVLDSLKERSPSQ